MKRNRNMTILTILAVVFSSSTLFGYLISDFDHDGIVNGKDLAVFSRQWLVEDSNGIGSSGGTATYVVAASDAPWHVKSQADYVCDGIADDVQIQAAIDALPTVAINKRGGHIVLSSGNFNISSTILVGKQRDDEIVAEISGSGPLYSTHLKLANNSNCAIMRIGYDPRKSTPGSFDNNQSAWLNLRNIHFDGNLTNQTSNTYSIIAVNTGNKTFTVSGDQTNTIKPFEVMRIYGSTGNNGFYSISSVTFTGGNTEIVVHSTPVNGTVDGIIKVDPPVIDAVAWQDGMLYRCFVERGIGTGVQMKKSWTVYLTQSSIEHNTDAGLIIAGIEDESDGHTFGYTNKYITIRDCVFINNITTSPGSAAGIYMLSGDEGRIRQLNIVNNYFDDNYRDAIRCRGTVYYLNIIGNLLTNNGWEADDTYYAFCFESNGDNQGATRVNIMNNIINQTCYAHSLEKLKATIGLLGSGSGSLPDTITASGNFNVGGKPLSYCNNIQVNRAGKFIPNSPNEVHHHWSGPVDIYGFQCYGQTFTNKGASGSVEFNLPYAYAGQYIVFIRVADQNIVLDPFLSQTIDGSSSSKTLSSGNVTIIRCSEDTVWVTQ